MNYIKFNNKNFISPRNMIPIENEDFRKVKVNETKYRSIIWNLLYLSICTRHDIIFPVSKAARRAKETTIEDWNNVIRILRYLKDTNKYSINFTNNPNIKAYIRLWRWLGNKTFNHSILNNIRLFMEWPIIIFNIPPKKKKTNNKKKI